MNCCLVRMLHSCIPGYLLPFLCYRSESAENITNLLERNRALQEENNKLSKELSEAAGQTAFMFEKIITVSQTLHLVESFLGKSVKTKST